MSEIVERVARAIAEKSNGIDQWDAISEDGDGCGYLGKNDFRQMSRAAIAKISEILSNSDNSSLAYTADKLAGKLKEDA